MSVKIEEKIAEKIELTAFERYWGCKPEQIVLTKEEERRWKGE